MSTVPVGDIDLLAMSPQQFFSLMEEDKPASSRAMRTGKDRFFAGGTAGSSSAHPASAGIFSANPLETIDRGNEWLKDHTYVDMFGWKDAILDGRTAVKQVMLLGLMGDAYLTRNRAGKEVVIFKGYAGLREKLPGTRYLRENPVVHAADLVIGHKEMLEEAGKATKIAIVCFIAWDIVHECLQDKPDMTRLGVSILSDIFQTVAATYIGVGAGVVATIAGAPVVFAFCVVAVFTFTIGVIISREVERNRLIDKAVEIAKNIEKSQTVKSFIDFANATNKLYVESYKFPMAYMSY